MKEFTIVRERWLAGKRRGLSMLLKPTEPGSVTIPDSDPGLSCCLGFMSLEFGIPRNMIFGLASLSGLDLSVISLLPEQIRPYHHADHGFILDTDLARKIMVQNDLREVTEDVREARLIELFAEADLRPIFI